MTTVLRASLIVSLLLVCVTGVDAQHNGAHPIDIQLSKCLDDTANQTTVGMRQCAYAAMNGWDTELNKNYQALLGKLSLEGQGALRDAQRAWLSFRDEQFAFNNEFYMSEMQGTMFQVIATSTNMELVKARALELETLLNALKDQ